MQFTRRQMLLGSLAAAGGVLLTGCGGGGEQAGGGEAGDGGAEGFPVTIEHRFGTTTIERTPQRVVTIGYQEHDPVLALGVAPIGVRYWYGAEDNVIFPWAQQAAQAVDARPQILNMSSLEPERIAALQPDLILGIYSDLTPESYATISAIAPTVGAPAEYSDYGVPWQESTRIIGRALGRSERAEELVTGLQSRFDQIRGANPQFAGTELAVATFGADNIGVFASQDPRSRFFTELGFTIPPKFDELAGTSFYANLSFEEAAEVDREVLVWDQISYTPGGRATITGNPLVSRLAATRENRAVYLEGATENAFAWQSVLSIPLALDAIVPELERIVPRT